MDYVMRRRSTVGGALEMFSLLLPLPLQKYRLPRWRIGERPSDMEESRQASVELMVPLTTRAAAFNTRCNLLVVAFGVPARNALQQSVRDATNECTSVAADSVSSERRHR